MNRNDLPAPNATCEVCGRKYYRCKRCIEMKMRGIETWRIHCDSIECYQVLTLANTEDVSKITEEEFNRITSLELPEERKPVKDIQDKLDRIKDSFKKTEKSEKAEKNVITKDNNDKGASNWKTTKNSHKQFNQVFQGTAKNVK